MSTTRLHNAYPINRREARDLAAFLREAGYESVSIARCNDYVCNVVRFFGGANPEHAAEVHAMAMLACGFDEVEA